jgi:hypothetical protein
MKILAHYNYLFKKGELVYINDPILKIKGLARVTATCYLDRLPKKELGYGWSYELPFPQILVKFENDTRTQTVNYPCNEFKFISKLVKVKSCK